MGLSTIVKFLDNHNIRNKKDYPGVFITLRHAISVFCLAKSGDGSTSVKIVTIKILKSQEI
jgi:hypothetical protein